MTVVVENSADQVQAYTTGNGVFPISAEIKADNAKQEAKANGGKVADTKTDDKGVTEEPKAEGAKEDKEADDVEGEDGLTPRQKREYTAAMLKTIGKQHRLRREAEEFATAQFNEKELATQRAAKLEADLAILREQLKPVKVEELKEPARPDFKTDQEYWDAMVDFRVDKKLRTQAAADEKRAEEAFQAESAQHAQAKMDRGLELGPEDFKEVFESADMILPTYVLEAIKESDLMPELVYHLGVNREKAQKIAALTQGQRPGTPQFIKAAQRQLVEIGKIESTLQPFASKKANGAENAKDDEPSTDGDKPSPETGSAPSKPRVTAPIIEPLRGSSAGQVQTNEAEMTTNKVITTWTKKHNSNLLARKRH